MGSESDREYSARRERDERAAALHAATPLARDIHLTLADHHARLAQPPDHASDGPVA